MASNSAIESDLLIDLESGINATKDEDEDSTDIFLNVNKAWSGSAGDDGYIKGDEAWSLRNGTQNSKECPSHNAEPLGDRRYGGEEKIGVPGKKAGAEKPKKKGCKKPPKPPRPPNSPPLDSAEQKLLREIHELAMLKRARVERMKAIKKMKNTKQSSSSNNLWALVITFLFCLVILWQGVFSRGTSSVSFHGSPESSEGSRSGLISVQFYSNASNSDPGGSLSTFPNIMEEASGMGSPEEQ